MSLTEQEQKEFWASLALRHTRGLGPRSWKRLLEAYGSAYESVMQARSWAADGVARAAVSQALLSDAWRPRAREEWDAARRLGCGILLYTSAYYPQRLREIPDPPLYLYAEGEASLLQGPGVGVVGTRRSSPYGRDATRELCLGLSKSGMTIISGMAYGIDRHAHLAGLQGPGSSIAVLGAGLDINYPSGNADVRALLREKGLVLSEYPPGCFPEPRNFPVRNRIISGLALGAIVVEASEKSGSMITARQAMEQGRDVFAVPGPRGSQNHAGCFRLINQGAKLVCSAEEVLRELAPLLREWRDAPQGQRLSESLQSLTPASCPGPQGPQLPRSPQDPPPPSPAACRAGWRPGCSDGASVPGSAAHRPAGRAPGLGLQPCEPHLAVAGNARPGAPVARHDLQRHVSRMTCPPASGCFSQTIPSIFPTGSVHDLPLALPCYRTC